MKNLIYLQSFIFIILFLSSCGPKPPPTMLPPPEKPADQETYDPSTDCQQAMEHFVELSIKAIGSGPTNKQREMVLGRCTKITSGRAIACILRIKRLYLNTNRELMLNPIWRCFKRN